MKEKPPKNAALLYDDHLKVWELWHKSRPVVSSVEKSRVQEWAAEHGYTIVYKGGDAVTHFDADCRNYKSGDSVVDALGTYSHVTCDHCRNGGGVR